MELAVTAISQRCRERGQHVWDVRGEKVNMANEGETRWNRGSNSHFSPSLYLITISLCIAEDIDIEEQSLGRCLDLVQARASGGSTGWNFLDTPPKRLNREQISLRVLWLQLDAHSISQTFRTQRIRLVEIQHLRPDQSRSELALRYGSSRSHIIQVLVHQPVSVYPRYLLGRFDWLRILERNWSRYI